MTEIQNRNQEIIDNLTSFKFEQLNEKTYYSNTYDKCLYIHFDRFDHELIDINTSINNGDDFDYSKLDKKHLFISLLNFGDVDITDFNDINVSDLLSYIYNFYFKFDTNVIEISSNIVYLGKVDKIKLIKLDVFDYNKGNLSTCDPKLIKDFYTGYGYNRKIEIESKISAEKRLKHKINKEVTDNEISEIYSDYDPDNSEFYRELYVNRSLKLRNRVNKEIVNYHR